MSIAVSAVVRRSAMLASGLLVMSLACLAIGAAIALGMVGALPLAPRSLLGACCMLAAAAAVFEIVRPYVVRRILITPAGKIHLTDLVAHESVAGAGVSDLDAMDYQLLPTSTLWSFLMILNLRASDGAKVTLFVLPDTMTQASFRALCVACHWIAAHNIRAGSENA